MNPLLMNVLLPHMCQGWELLVLSRLKWDLAAITPNDFVNPLIRRLSAWTKGKEIIMKRHTQTFIALCAAGESMMKGKKMKKGGHRSYTLHDEAAGAAGKTSCSMRWDRAVCVMIAVRVVL